MNKYSRQKYLRSGQGGQVLVFALVIMVAAIVGALLVFDIHSVLIGKVKGQNAVDAAALTGAKWQQHALNLIGELNLVKATTVLIHDPYAGVEDAAPGYEFFKMGTPDDYMAVDENGNSYFDAAKMKADLRKVEEEREKLLDAVALLSQMQTRVSFVMPLLGFGAAQQAAKNNGITANQDAGVFLYDFYLDVMDETLYGNPEIARQVINDYEWRIPYASMLYDLTGAANNSFNGIAAGTKIDWLGAPNLQADPPNEMLSYLTNKSFYTAVLSNSWCELRHLLLNKTFGARWWGAYSTSYTNMFSGESEILPLNVNFFTGSAPVRNDYLKQIFPNRYNDTGDVQPLAEMMDTEDPYIPPDFCYSYDKDTKNVYLYSIEYRIGKDGVREAVVVPLKLDGKGRPVANEKDTDRIFNYLPDFKWCVYDSSRWMGYSDEMKDSWRLYLNGDFRDGYDYYSGAVSWFEIRQAPVSWLGHFFSEGARSDKLELRDKSAMNSVRNAQRMLRQDLNDVAADALAKPYGRLKIENEYKPPFYAGNLILPVFTDTALIPVSLEPVYGYRQIDREWLIFVTKYLPLLGETSSLDDMEGKIRDLEREEQKSYWSSCVKYHEALLKFNNPDWRQMGIDWLNTPIRFDEETGQPTRWNKDNCNYWPSGGSGTREGPGAIH